LFFLRSTFVPFLVGVILTSVIFVFLRPTQTTKTPEVTPSSTPEEEIISVTERERCEKVLGLFSVPLLKPPTFHSSTPSPIITNFEGEAYIKWNSVPKAKSYFIIVENAEGKELRSYRTPYIAIYLKSLPRPEKLESEKYHVKIATVNANDVVGKFSTPRVLVVKKTLNLTAPKIQEIRVED